MPTVQIGKDLHPNEKTSSDFNRLMGCSLDKLNRVFKNPEKKHPDFWKSFEWETAKAISTAESELHLNWIIDYKDNSHRFPDIVAQINHDHSIGIEIKTIASEKKGWKTLGGSILESTKMPGLERIYVLCAKQPPAFAMMLKPFEDCVCGVQVTHSPRYVLDLGQQPSESLFVKIDKSYQEVCAMESPFDAFRKYLLQQKNELSGNSTENYWWCPKEVLNEEEVSEQEFANKFINTQLHFWRDLKPNLRHYLSLEMVSLFPEIIFGNYTEAVRWLLTTHFTVHPSFRDIFSAGGKVSVFNPTENKMEKIPQVVGFLLENQNDLAMHFNKMRLKRWKTSFEVLSLTRKSLSPFSIETCKNIVNNIEKYVNDD